MDRHLSIVCAFFMLLLSFSVFSTCAQEPPIKVEVRWDRVIRARIRPPHAAWKAQLSSRVDSALPP